MSSTPWVLVAALTGLIGAATGVTALALQVWQFQLSGPHVKTNASTGFSTQHQRWGLLLEVVNVGRLPITITSVGVELSDRQHVPLGGMNADFFQGPDLPTRINGGDAARWMVEPDWILLAIANRRVTTAVRGRVDLATGKTVRSKTTQDAAHLASLNEG